MKGARRAWLFQARRIRSPPRTSSLCTSSPCMVTLLPPVARPALASALPRRRSLRGCPCQVITVRGLIALRAGLSGAATPHLHPVHARTARVLGPHRAAAHASEFALRATARSGPFASARVLLLRSHAYAACICAVLAPMPVPAQLPRSPSASARPRLFPRRARSLRAARCSTSHAPASATSPALALATFLPLQHLHSSVHHQHCIAPPALTRAAAPARPASALQAARSLAPALLAQPLLPAAHSSPEPSPCARGSRAALSPARRARSGAARAPRTPARAVPAEPPPYAPPVPPASARSPGPAPRLRPRATRPRGTTRPRASAWPGAARPARACTACSRGKTAAREPRENSRERERKNREEREIELPKDLCAILENCRDLSVKHNFPSI
jgi:hypothetical protein